MSFPRIRHKETAQIYSSTLLKYAENYSRSHNIFLFVKNSMSRWVWASINVWLMSFRWSMPLLVNRYFAYALLKGGDTLYMLNCTSWNCKFMYQEAPTTAKLKTGIFRSNPSAFEAELPAWMIEFEDEPERLKKRTWWWWEWSLECPLFVQQCH